MVGRLAEAGVQLSTQNERVESIICVICPTWAMV